MKYKIKTMRQILEEFPDAYFGYEGRLYCDGWNDCILPFYFDRLGGEIELDEFYHDRYNVLWEKKWLEPLPEAPIAYYRWRLYFKNGGIHDRSVLVSEDGMSGTGKIAEEWYTAIHREKISEAVYKIEGQE